MLKAPCTHCAWMAQWLACLPLRRLVVGSSRAHTKVHIINGTNYLPAWHAGMHYKDLLRSNKRERYRILVPDFYLVLYDLRCRKRILMD